MDVCESSVTGCDRRSTENDPPFPDNFRYDKNPDDCFSDLLDFLYIAIDADLRIVNNKDPVVQTQLVNVIQEDQTSLQVSTQTSAPHYNSRSSKRVKKHTQIPPPSASLSEPPPLSWEDTVRQKLTLTEQDYDTFRAEQGFSRIPRVSDSFFDFGTPDVTLERMPRYATNLPSRLCKESAALSVYKNLQSGRADGMNLHISSIEQAFAKPKNSNNNNNKKVQRQQKQQQTRATDDRELQWEDTIVTIDFYHPSAKASVIKKAASDYSRGPVLASTIELLGNQTLENLQSRLFCENDFIYTTEIRHPRDAENLNLDYFSSIYDQRTFQSGCIVIDKTAYVGDVMPNYGLILKKWEEKIGPQSEPYKTASIQATKLKDIEFKLGQPYLYIHSPNCEHLLVFKEVRYLHKYDPQKSEAFPRLTYTGGFTTIPCRVNDAHIARYVVKDCDRLPEPLTPLCRQCCEKFCYTSEGHSKDVPVGTFKLYPLVQVSSLLLNDNKISR